MVPKKKPQRKYSSLLDPRLWGIPKESVKGLSKRLYSYWERFKRCFQTKTKNMGIYALHYISGELRMDTERNFTNIAREVGVSSQSMQHFMSYSPWSKQEIYKQVQSEIQATPGLEENDGVLVLDESADKKAGDKSAGAGRQHNGNLGKVDMSQVGVFLSYVNGSLWTFVEGELFLPKKWFSPKKRVLFKRLGIPKGRRFATKIEIGYALIKRLKDNGLLKFNAICCDSLYGRNTNFRAKLAKDNIIYMADVPVTTLAYLEDPTGKDRQVQPLSVSDIAKRKDTHFQRVMVRNTERGILNDLFAIRRVWVVQEKEVLQQWLVIRDEEDGKSYALCNAPIDTPLERLAWLKCQRWFVERTIQDAKQEAGFDEFQAQLYLAWEHHLALTVMATWFISQTKLEWAKTSPKDPVVNEQLQTSFLPALSVSNIRTLLRSVMPLHQLTIEQAQELVVEHLLNRTLSRKSRLKSKETKSRSP